MGDRNSRWNMNIHYHRVFFNAIQPDTEFLCGDVFTHSLAPGSFDVVVASAMLHHVDAGGAVPSAHVEPLLARVESTT